MTQRRSCGRLAVRRTWPISCVTSLWSYQLETVIIVSNTEDEKSGRDGADLGSSDYINFPRLEFPRDFYEKRLHEMRGTGSPVSLIFRLTREHELGRSASLPLTNEELAKLVELYDDAPTKALREVLVRELRSQRRLRPGRKADLTSSQRLERHLLPILYNRAMRVGSWLRRQLIRKEESKKRRESVEAIPTQAALAMAIVRERLPSTRGLSDKALANKLSAMKDPSDKRSRTKAAKR